MKPTQQPPLPFVANFHPSPFIPSELLSARHCISPQGIGVIPMQFPARPYPLLVPAFPEDHLVLHVQNATNLQGKLVHNFDVVSHPGDIFIVPHGAASEWQNERESQALLLFLAPSLLTDLALEAFDLDPARAPLLEQVATPDPLVQAIGQALLQERQSPGSGDRLYTESLLNTLVLHLLHHYGANPQNLPTCKGGLAPAALRHVLDYIHEHLAHELTLARLAKEANLSAYHFTRLFKQSMGESLHQYVIRQRVEAAQRLLLHEPLTLTDVAAQVGFANQSHLGRHCKALLGVTPKMLVKERKNLPNPRKNRQDPTV